MPTMRPKTLSCVPSHGVDRRESQQRSRWTSVGTVAASVAALAVIMSLGGLALLSAPARAPGLATGGGTASDEPSLETHTASPAGSQDVLTGTARDELFELTIKADRGRYQADEPIEVSSVLRYVGAAEQTTVSSHGAGMVAFSIEQLDGPMDAGPGRDFSCGEFEYRTGQLERIRFQKSGGFDTEEPLAGFWRAFFADPDLRLPEGHYRISAIADYSISGCGAGRTLAAWVDITVGARASAPTATPVQETVADERFELTIEADRGVHEPDLPIAITTTLRYVAVRTGDVPDTRTSTAMSSGSRSRSRVGSVSDPMTDFWRDWIDDPELRLLKAATASVPSPPMVGRIVRSGRSVTASVELEVAAPAE